MGFDGNVKGWSVITGTDVTDVDLSFSVLYGYSQSTWFKATAVAAAIQSDFIEVQLATALECTLIGQRTSGTGKLYVVADYYDASYGHLHSGQSVKLTFTANGAWEAARGVVQDTSLDNRAKFVKITVGKVTASAEEFFVGALDFRVCKRQFVAHKNADQTITAAGGEQTVTWDYYDNDIGAVFQRTANTWQVIADDTGATHARKEIASYTTLWHFGCYVQYTDLSDAGTAYVAIRQNSTLKAAHHDVQARTGELKGLQAHIPLMVAENDTVDVRTDHNSGSDRHLDGTSGEDASRFWGFEISP